MKSEARKKQVRYWRMTQTQEIMIARKVVEHLLKCYPGYGWAAYVEGGMVDIWVQGLDSINSYKLNTLSLTPEMKEVMRAGGEILERYRQSRVKGNQEEIFNAQRNIKGHAVPSL
jgi:hypothetical protein